MSARFAYAAAATALIAFVAVVAFTAPTAIGYPRSDAWVHVAAIGEWAHDLWSPGHPHLPVDAGSARYIPLLFPFAALGAVTGWGEVTLFAVAATLGAAFVFSTIYAFFRFLLPDHPWAPVAGLLSFTFLWGLGLPWSNMFELRSLLEVSGYPSAWAFGSGLLLVMAADRYAAGARTLWLWVVLALSAVTFISHPITALFMYSLTACVLLLRHRGRLMPLAVAGATGAALSLVWPYFSIIDVIDNPVFDPSLQRLLPQFYEVDRVIALVAPALVGVFALTRLPTHARRVFAAAITTMAGLWLINIWIPVPVGDRFLVFAVIYLQIVTVIWLVTSWEPDSWSRPLGTVVRVTAALLIVGHTALAVTDVGGRRVNVGRVLDVFNSGDDAIVAQLEDLAVHFDENGVAMADVSTRWMMPAVAGKVVSVSRDIFGVDDAVARFEAATEFFGDETPRDRRFELLDRYDADYVLFAPGDHSPATVTDLTSMGEAFTSRFFTLVQVANR